MPSEIMRFFTYDHLSGNLKKVSREVCALAEEMDISLPEGAEKQAGLRHLLEAKDCFVRTML